MNLIYKIFNFLDLDKSGDIDSYKFICGLSLIRQYSMHVKKKIKLLLTN